MSSLRLGFLSLLLFGASPLEAADTPALLRIREVIASGENEVRVVCFGDSVTGIYYHTGGRSAYPEVIRDALKARHPEGRVKVINAGKSGHTTTNGLGRIQQDVLVHKPHLVTVMFGLNDVAKGTIDLYRKNLIEIVTKCRSAGAEVILCTPNAVSETPDRPIAKVATFAEVVRAVAHQMSVPLADAHASLGALRESAAETWRLSMSDEIHPNLRGHRRLAEAIGIDRNSASQLVEGLERRGLIAREVDPQDRRARVLHLTGQGRTLRDRVRPRMLEANARVLEPLASWEAEAFLALLVRMVDHHEALARPGAGRRPRRSSPKAA